MVNGIRGKTDVTRLITAGLRKGGKKVYARTTGTNPENIDEKGEITIEKRKSPARIDEVISFIKKIYLLNPDIIIVECMAINPFLQEVLQRQIIRSNIVIITNIRLDHTDILGKTKQEIAVSMCASIPKKGILFSSEQQYRDLFEKVSFSRNSRFKFVETRHFSESHNIGQFDDNISIALAVCSYLGVDENTALKGMYDYTPDEGIFSIIPCMYQGNTYYFANALAANDPDSTDILLKRTISQYPDQQIIGIFCTRNDRRWRENLFSLFLKDQRFDSIHIANNKNDIFNTIIKEQPNKTVIFLFGNFNGIGKKILKDIKKCHIN